MRRTLLPIALIAVTLTAAGCGSSTTSSSSAASTAATGGANEAPLPDSGLPAEALPEVPEGKNGWTECPYLDSNWVADTNGQRMVGQGIDSRFDTPACVFWSYPEDPQATVMVRHMATEQDAIKVVDWAAPIDTTEPAEEPAGWSGGRIGNEKGATYAVQKGNVAVVVFSNQPQSLKAELIAKETISRLAL